MNKEVEELRNDCFVIGDVRWSRMWRLAEHKG